MKRTSRLRDLMSRPLPRPDLGFFWQLITAFTLITALVGGGMVLAGRAAFKRLDSFVQDRFSTAGLWADRLAGHYEESGSWEGVDALIQAH